MVLMCTDTQFVFFIYVYYNYYNFTGQHSLQTRVAKPQAVHKGGRIWTDTEFFLALTMLDQGHTSSVLATGSQHIFPPKCHRMAYQGCIPAYQWPFWGTCETSNNRAPWAWMCTKTPHFPLWTSPCQQPLSTCPSTFTACFNPNQFKQYKYHCSAILKSNAFHS